MWQISRVRRAKRKGGDEKSVGYIAGRFRTRHRGWRLATGRCPKTRHCYCSSLHPFLSIAPNSDFGVTHTCMQARMHARMHERVWGTIERVNKRRLRLRRGTRIARLTMRTKYSRVRICSLTIVGENVCVCVPAYARTRESSSPRIPMEIILLNKCEIFAPPTLQLFSSTLISM